MGAFFFSGALVKLRKATISFAKSVCLSIAPSVRMETTRLPLEGFFKKFDISIFIEILSRY